MTNLPAETLPQETIAPCPPGADDSTGWLRATVLVAAAWTIGMAQYVHEGFFTPTAIKALLAGVVLTLAAVCVPSGSRRWRIVCDVAFAVALGLQFYCLVHEYAGSLASTDPSSVHRQIFNTVPRPNTAYLNPPIFQWGVLVAAVATVLLYSGRAAIVRGAFLVAVVAHLVLTISFVQHTYPPYSDVFVVQQKGAAAVMEGGHPFKFTIPNMFNLKAGDMPLDKDGNIVCGYTYAPFTLLLSIPSYVLTGDCRYGHALAYTLAGALLGFLRPGRYAKLAALLFLFTPRLFNDLEIGGTEAFVVLFFVVTVFAAVRQSPQTPFWFGLCLASKQYTVFLLPLGMLLINPQVTWRKVLSFYSIAISVLLLVTLPLVVMDWEAAWYCIFDSQAKFLSLNQYSLTFPSWALWHFPRETALKLIPAAFVLATGVSLYSSFRVRRTPANFCLAAAVAYLLFFTFNKHAFSRYYAVTICMTCSAIAASLSAFPVRANSNPVPDSPPV